MGPIQFVLLLFEIRSSLRSAAAATAFVFFFFLLSTIHYYVAVAVATRRPLSAAVYLRPLYGTQEKGIAQQHTPLSAVLFSLSLSLPVSRFIAKTLKKKRGEDGGRLQCGKRNTCLDSSLSHSDPSASSDEKRRDSVI